MTAAVLRVRDSKFRRAPSCPPSTFSWAGTRTKLPVLGATPLGQGHPRGSDAPAFARAPGPPGLPRYPSSPSTGLFGQASAPAHPGKSQRRIPACAVELSRLHSTHHLHVPRGTLHDRGVLLPLKGKNMFLIHVILVEIPDVLPRLASCALMTAEKRHLYHNR